MVADVGETDFAVIVYREEDQWEADVLPTAVTADLDDFLQALRRQPSMGGTIGFAGVGDDFWVAVRVVGEDVSLYKLIKNCKKKKRDNKDVVKGKLK